MYITNLFKDYQKNQEEYYPIVWYHGTNYPFTFSCGYCSMSINEGDKTCKFCSKKIAWEKGEKDNEQL